MKATCLVLFGIGLGVVTTGQNMAFEVASIKRNVSADQNASVRGQSGRVTITNNTLFNIIRNAYNVQRFQMVSGERAPSWLDTDRWDIVATTDGKRTQQEMLAMLQNLLADRFKLVVRRETREIPVFGLVLARADERLGPQLRKSTVECMAPAGPNGGAPPPQPAGPGAGVPNCGTRVGRGSVVSNGVLLADFARNLSPLAARVVVDKTGLTGAWDLDLTWAPDADGAGTGTPSTTDGPSLFTAVQEQLGLKLDPQRGAVAVLVIDSAERPTED
jgi:uncharacterized protein (TIGR03435 family)